MTPLSQCSIIPRPLKQFSQVFEKDLKLSRSSSLFDIGLTFISGIHLPKSIAGSQTWKSESGEYLKMSWQPSRLIWGTGGCLCRSFFSVMNVKRLFLSVIVWMCLARLKLLKKRFNVGLWNSETKTCGTTTLESHWF